MRILLLVVILFSLSCKREVSGSFNISGYYYDSCGGKPLINYHVYFRNYSNQLFETYTDSVGYFQLKGSFSYTIPGIGGNDPNPRFIEFRDTSQNSTCCQYAFLSQYSNFKNDTVYGYNSVNAVLNIHFSTTDTIGTEKDTLFLSYNYVDYNGTRLPRYRSDTKFYSIDYNTYYVGPFYRDKILDTVKMRVSPHVGRMEGQRACTFRHVNETGILNSGEGYYSFVNGQKNIGCSHVELIDLSILD